MDGYVRVNPMEMKENFIEMIGKDWLLVTAGNKDSYNAMTISWGGMGYIWNKPAAFTFIRKARYTYEFIQREEGYTLSLFAPEYKKALGVCGTKSGRDTDKIKEAGLTGMELPSGLMAFEEARVIFECRKMLVTEVKHEDMVDSYREDIVNQWYTKEGDTSYHTMYVSEIVNVWVKQ